MSKARHDDPDIADEYDFSDAVRGKHFQWAKRAKGRFVIVSDEEDRQRQAASARDGTPPQSDRS